MRRAARILGCCLLLSTLACQQELDSAPAADPLEDPWVNSIDEGESEPPVVVAAAPTPTPTPVPGPAAPVDPLASPQPGAGVEPSTVEVAKLAGASASVAKSANTSVTPANPEGSEPAAPPSEAVVPTTADAPAPTIDPAPAPAPAEPAPVVAPAITIADYEGNFRYSGGSSQRADLDQAIEDAVMQLAMPIRGIGRKRLTNTNPIDDSLEIAIDGDKVQTIFESGFDAECVVDGSTVKWTSKKGDKYKVRVRKKDTKIVQVIEGEDGVKTTVFVLSADKQSLTVHHKVTSDRLEVPMTYKLSYKRK
ncbi:hypothetical protein ACNOYE_27055 [Nannocystaceae bacterium ST9]